MKKLFIITGEHSGDKHASDVVREIRKLNPNIEIEGVGGQNLAELGVKLFCDHSKMSAVGFNTKIILTHIQLGQKVAKYIKEEFKPDMVLMIDYGGFNLNLSKLINELKINFTKNNTYRSFALIFGKAPCFFIRLWYLLFIFCYCNFF